MTVGSGGGFSGAGAGGQVAGDHRPLATALVLAAGSGQRFGASEPKALVQLAGRPLYEWSVDACLASPRIGRILVLVPPGQGSDFTVDGVELIDGDSARSKSVAAGLALVETEYVLIHDAARPLVTSGLIDAAIGELDSRPELDAVITAAAVTDTIKRVDSQGDVEQTLDRANLRAVQTPQVFRTEALRRASESGDLEKATDDAFLIESAGGRVGVLMAPATNIKVTVPADLVLAELLRGQSGKVPTPSNQN